MMKEFYLTIVRHGQTTANELKTIQGHSDSPLTELGIQQASALAKHFVQTDCCHFNRIYSSDLGRALKSCEIIANYGCSVIEPDIVKDARLRERKYGDLYEGGSIQQLQAAAFKFGFDSTNFTLYSPEGAESMEDVMKRVSDFCHETLFRDCTNGEQILLVSHWATIKEILKLFQPFSRGAIKREHLLETPNVAFSRFKIRCKQQDVNNLQSISILDDPNDLKLDISVVCLHQTLHLSLDQMSVNIKHHLD